MVGSPDVGKSMLAHRSPTIVPDRVRCRSCGGQLQTSAVCMPNSCAVRRIA